MEGIELLCQRREEAAAPLPERQGDDWTVRHHGAERVWQDHLAKHLGLPLGSQCNGEIKVFGAASFFFFLFLFLFLFCFCFSHCAVKLSLFSLFLSFFRSFFRSFFLSFFSFFLSLFSSLLSSLPFSLLFSFLFFSLLRSFLSFFLAQMQGDVRLNGLPYTNTELKWMSAYVMQDDLLNGHLTVEETLRYSAELRLPKGTSQELIQQRVDEVLKDMHIEHVRSVIVGTPLKKGISGGERKRLCVAMELLTKPVLLFLDEPTSGLDSVAALMLVSKLKSLSDSRKCTVVCTIHQPQVDFDLFGRRFLSFFICVCVCVFVCMCFGNGAKFDITHNTPFFTFFFFWLKKLFPHHRQRSSVSLTILS